MDYAKIDIYKLLMEKEKYRDEIKSFFIKKLKKDVHIKTLIKEFRISDSDLDDYFETLSLGWPMEELLSVMINEKVFRTYYKKIEISKGELLENIRKMKLHTTILHANGVQSKTVSLE